MGKYFLIFGLLNLCYCTSKKAPIVGTWRVDSRFYEATYKIEQARQSLQAQVLFYDDGTTRYNFKGGTKQYLFASLKAKNGQYLDGMSSATKQKSSTGKALPKFAIKPKGNDTLEVISYIGQRPLSEHWIRKK
ncbi:hypothetical protein BKI52_19925 [marine bacterium AO1-C]|nr:hypothetical protein BKI52_19925 [marine bacterium AO1-C]